MNITYYLRRDNEEFTLDFAKNLLTRMESSPHMIDEVGMKIDGERVKWIHPMKDITKREGNALINARQEFEDDLNTHRWGNAVWVQTGGRDHVDCASWSNEPEVINIQRARVWNRDLMKNGDGECSYWMRILSPDEAAHTNSSDRDHIMEAYENGHPYSVSYA